MRFQATFALLASSLALAAPNAVARNTMARDVATSANDMTAVIQFAAQADCDFFQCADVIASAGCIAIGIATGQVEAVLACVASGATGICPCAGCIDALNAFLTSHDVCT
ncbi:hypothetical protein BU23DRAFT_573406 [Bimuria novae-zelandiae CBS 107.79]|uniref:Fungal calcium binding protein domain-containing protein n=1 Tax=Bimuria novae-zelandiae CBS 107.79 TaxID=1447943 RepID=A0A6A5UWI0_9PLEO|nr:hypothetical protein BU23DRAFT_573406 [Bimuria novae-zelandiae CBS 107.79]